MTPYVVNLDGRRALKAVCAGGKGAGLAWLARRGLKVPRGFVVTSSAFRDVVLDRCVDVSADGHAWTRDALDRIRERVTSVDVPRRLARSIIGRYRSLGGPVAVRSSLVGEDGRISSYAGQLDTVLDVRSAEDVLDAVRQCWSSAFNWRNIRYLVEREELSATQALSSLSMAVIVQRMVDARAAGVAFSADPITGQRCVVVESTGGLGDKLVGGRVEPDRHVVDARGVLAETVLGDRSAPVLRNEQVLRLAEIVRDIARRLGTPQDVEWAWDGAEFHILQSRPITSLVGETVYSNEMVSDMAPGLITPLVYSTKIVTMAENVFGRLFMELLGSSETDYGQLLARIRSRVYTNVTLLGSLFERLGMPPNFFEVVSRGELAAARCPPLTLDTVRTLFRVTVFARRHSRIAGEMQTFARRHHRELERFRRTDWSDRDPQLLLKAFDQLMNLHGELQWYIFIGPINMMVRHRLLDRLVESRVQGVAASDLTCGLVGLKALEPNEGLRQLALQAQSLGGDALRSLVTGDDAAIREVLTKSGVGREMVHAVDAFLDRYGFLSPNGTDFAATPWIESPSLIWRAIGHYASSPPPPLLGAMEFRRDAARARARSQLPALHRELFDRLLSSTVTYIDLRERASLLMSEDSYQMRRIFLTLAARFVARGDLERSEDIFYLLYPEVRQLVAGELHGELLRDIVSRRRAEMEADAVVDAPNTICGDRVPRRPIPSPGGQEYLVGICGSSGVARGRACVVIDPTNVPKRLTQDDIVVVPFTDVGWTPLFPGIGGIVAETGGRLSHTSILAREYGLPAVVNVRHATRLLRDGQAITIDGDNGRVYLRHVAISEEGVS